MHFRRHLIQRWIGDEVSSAPSAPSRIATATAGDPDEAEARHAHDHFAALDWEREEFERELALHFVVKDLRLGLDDGGSAKVTTPSVRPPACLNPTSASKRARDSQAPAQSSTSTIQPLTPSSVSTAMPSLELPYPSPPPSSLHLRPTSLLSSVFRPPHKTSPSLLSLPNSHFSSCTSSSGTHSISTPSIVSQVGRKLATKLSETAETPHGLRPRRHVSSTPSLFPKKRRLIVRGIGMEDHGAVDGINRWANGLGAVSRISRSTDGALWIEFQDKRVAENVCCLQAQVQIPHVGRVRLDWAEGRHPG